MRDVLAAALFVAVATAWHPASSVAVAPPLTNEDVVRMVMTGTPQKKILETIEARQVDFDLSTEMVAELRTAGVNAVVVEAMQRRQAAMPTRPAPAPTPEAAVPTGTLHIDFPPPQEGTSAAAVSAVALKSLPKGMSRRGGVEVGLMTDLAFAVLCITADHVPDHWDSRSPVQGAPRHELLLFQPGSAVEKMKGHEVLYLTHEPSYDIRVPAGPHNIVVAAAGKQAGSGTWRLLESDGARIDVPENGTTRLALKATSRIGGSAMVGYKFDTTWSLGSPDAPPAAVQAAAPAPPGAVPAPTTSPETRP